MEESNIMNLIEILEAAMFIAEDAEEMHAKEGHADAAAYFRGKAEAYKKSIEKIKKIFK